MHKFFKLFVLLLILTQTTRAQEIKLKGTFLQDSIKIGEDVPFVFTARYPKEMVLVFPDSTFDYKPFEWVKQKYFPTRSDSVYSYDSVVYYLTTFEIDPIQQLQLSAFTIRGYDSVEVKAAPDSLFLSQMVQQVGPDTELKSNTEYEDVALDFNTLLWSIIGGSILLICLVLVLIFGKRIRRQIRIYVLKKRHEKFAKQFFEKMNRLANSGDKKGTESLLNNWKGYMERLERVPYSTLTTKEILKIHNREDIKSVLKQVDRSLYADQPLERPFEQFDVLLKFSVQQFEQKIESIRHDG